MMKKFLYAISIILSTVIVVILASNDGALLPRANQKPISIITATDLHYISTALNDNGAAFMSLMSNADGRVSQYVDEITDAFVEEVIAAKPDALILSGDLTFNGEKKSHEDLALKLREIKDAGIEVLLIPGNHDIWNMSAIEFVGDSIDYVETVTQKQFYEIYKDFGYQKAFSRDQESLSYIYSLRDDVKVLMLDANTDLTENVVLTSTMKWLERELKKAKSLHEEVIVVTHQNVLNHSGVFTEGYSLINSDEVAEMFRKYDVNYILSGHIHLQDIKTEDNITEIATSSMTVSPIQYGVVTYDGNGLAYNTKPIDVSSWARANNKTDENLLNFEKYAKDYFLQNAYDSARKITKELSVTDEQGERMAKFYSYINANYFAGLPSDISGYDYEISLWRNTEGRFTRYVESIIASSTENKQIYT